MDTSSNKPSGLAHPSGLSKSNDICLSVIAPTSEFQKFMSSAEQHLNNSYTINMDSKLNFEQNKKNLATALRKGQCCIVFILYLQQ